MARIHNGILGKTTGKVASVVGSTWKGINYIRQRVVPKNPRTELQQGQRAAMRLAVWWSKKLIQSYTRPILDRFVRRQSGYNALIRWNILNFAGIASGNDIPTSASGFVTAGVTRYETWDSRFTTARGSLSIPLDITAVDSGTRPNREMRVVWDFTGAEGLFPTDYVVATLSDVSGKMSALTRMAPVSANIIEFSILDTVWQAFSRNTYKYVLSVQIVRFLHPDTRQVPIEISNSRSLVLGGNAIAPLIGDLLAPLEKEPENLAKPLNETVNREEREVGRKIRETVLKEEVIEREHFNENIDVDTDIITTETETRAAHVGERGKRGGRRASREELAYND